MQNVLISCYGILAYIAAMAGLVYFILFLGDWPFMPHRINGLQPGNIGLALLVNSGLMALFGLQHSIMARPRFKAVFTRIIPAAAERSTYVMLTGVLMVLISVYWQPLPGVLWQAKSPTLQALLMVGSAIGWSIAVIATFLINHFELFGLQQVYLNLTRKPEPAITFTEHSLYRLVRHPLQFGILIGIWCTPLMTSTHLFLAATMTIYIFIGLYFEEKDLVASLGDRYSDYQARVRQLLPLPRFTSRQTKSDKKPT